MARWPRPDPSAFVIGTKGYELAPYGIMQPKDDPAFKKVVDGAVLDMIKNGKVAALYEKYFNSPIPPKQINLVSHERRLQARARQPDRFGRPQGLRVSG